MKSTKNMYRANVQIPFVRGATSLNTSHFICRRQLHLRQRRNIIGRKPTSFVRSTTSFICVRLQRNDVDIQSNDVACKHANDVVSCGHKWKNPSRRTWIFWQGHKGSNSGHAVLETAALPTELYPWIYIALQHDYCITFQRENQVFNLHNIEPYLYKTVGNITAKR